MTNRDETPVDIDNTPIEGSAWTPKQVRILKIAVIAMGVALVGGFLLIIATIAFQATQMGLKKETPETGSEVSPPHSSAASNEVARDAFDVAIPEGAEVTGLSLDGNRLALQLKTASGTQVLVVDLTTGKTVSRIDFQPE